MNEFENALQSMQPADGRSDPMQIMFLAGQQSSQPSQRSNGAGGWKLVSGCLSVTCLCLLTGLILVSVQRPESMAPEAVAPKLAGDDSTHTAGSSDQVVLDVNRTPNTASSYVEVDLDHPESWNRMGPRVRQLMTATRTTAETHGGSSGELTPYSFSRQPHETWNRPTP